MNAEELKESAEHAQHSGQKAIGLTMAIVAVLLAMATLLGHRAHTEEVLSLTQNVDDWNFYQAKHNRTYQFALAAETQALLPNGHDTAVKNLKIALEEECGFPAPNGCAASLVKKMKSPVLEGLIGQEKLATEKSDKPGAVTSQAKVHEAGASGEKHEQASKEGGAKESAVKEGAAQLQERARDQQKETELVEHKANYYDGAELFLEVSIVLCSIALLAGAKRYWRLSFVSTAIGVGIAIYGLFLR